MTPLIKPLAMLGLALVLAACGRDRKTVGGGARAELGGPRLSKKKNPVEARANASG